MVRRIVNSKISQKDFIFLLELATPSLTVAFSFMFLLLRPMLVYTTRIVLGVAGLMIQALGP